MVQISSLAKTEGSQGTNKEIFEMLICLHPCLQDASSKVHAARILFQTKKHLPSSRGAVNTNLYERDTRLRGKGMLTTEILTCLSQPSGRYECGSENMLEEVIEQDDAGRNPLSTISLQIREANPEEPSVPLISGNSEMMPLKVDILLLYIAICGAICLLIVEALQPTAK